MADPREQYLPGELESLLALGAGPNLPPEVIEQMLVERGVRSPRRAPRDPGPLIPLDTPLSALVEQMYNSATETPIPGPPGEPPAPPSGAVRPEGLRGGAAPPAPSGVVDPGGEPWLQQFITPASPQAMLGGINRMMAQGTPGSAMPGDMAQTGGFNMPPGAMPPPEKPGGAVYTGPGVPPMKPGMLSIPAIRQQMLMAAAAQQSPLAAVAGAGNPGVPGAPGAPPVVAPPDPIAKGAAAAQQAAAASAAQQAQTAPADPFAGLPPALADALREYTNIAAELKKEDDAARWMALAKAGFAMAGSNKGFFGALGDGGMAGLEAFQAAEQAEAQRRMQAAGMNMDVAKIQSQWLADQAAAARQAEQDILDAEYKRARIGSLNRSNRGGGGTSTAQNGITQAQYLSMIQREVDNLMNSGPKAMEYAADPAAARRDAMANVESYLEASGITVRGRGGAPDPGGGGGDLTTVADVPDDVLAVAANDGDVIQSDDGSVWLFEDGEYTPYSGAQ